MLYPIISKLNENYTSGFPRFIFFFLWVYVSAMLLFLSCYVEVRLAAGQ